MDPCPTTQEVVTMKKYAPTKKWWAALVTGLVPILISGIESGFDETELKLLGPLAVALAGAYIKRNDATPGGVPNA